MSTKSNFVEKFLTRVHSDVEVLLDDELTTIDFCEAVVRRDDSGKFSELLISDEDTTVIAKGSDEGCCQVLSIGIDLMQELGEEMPA